MRKVILQEFVTLDNLAAGPNDSVDIITDSTRGEQSFGQGQKGFIDTVDTILLGSVTYRMFAGYWPKVTTGRKTVRGQVERDPENCLLENAGSRPVGRVGRRESRQGERG